MEVGYEANDGSTVRATRPGGTPNIPPYAENWHLTGITPITEDITLYAMSPHMHLRGKSLRWVVTYPDGHEQTILDVPKFDFNWQINYELAEPLHIPAGSKIAGIGVYDNSLKNKWNPARSLKCSGRSRAGTRCISRSPSTRWTARILRCRSRRRSSSSSRNLRM